MVVVSPLLVVVLLATGLVLVASGLRPRPRAGALTGARLAEWRPRLARAAAAGAGAGLLTRWPVAAVAGAGLGLFWDELFPPRSARALALARTEAVASWTEMLRDTLAASKGLEGAIAATAPLAPEAIRAEVCSLAARLPREPLAPALADLAAALAHPTADLVVTALASAATGGVRDLGELLSALAATAREEVELRLRVEAARARSRSAVRVITATTLATAVGLAVLNRSYLDPYQGLGGQLVLGLVAACFAAGFWGLAALSRHSGPERFLAGPVETEGG